MASVLVVDDEDIIVEMLRVLLSSSGHEVICLRDGGEAIEYIRSNHAFDLLITDLRMRPVHGMEILKAAHELRPDTPSIVVSAYFSEENVAKAESFGARAFIKKPFGIDDLLAKIQDALGTGESLSRPTA